MTTPTRSKVPMSYTPRSRFLVLCWVSLLLAMALVPMAYGQASKQGEKAADSLKALAKTVQEGQVTLTEATRALDQLVNKPNEDLKKPFKAYEKALKRLSKLAEDARKRRDGLAKNREAYIAAWEKDLLAIQQDDIRARGAERMQKVQVSLKQLSELAAEAGKNYQAYEAQLLDIQKALGADLTPNGVRTIAPIANQARVSAVAVRDSLANLRAELQALGLAMSSKSAK